MKTVDDIRTLFELAEDEDCYQSVADAWKADVEDINRRVGFYFSYAQKQTAKAVSLREKLRKLREELGEAKALCGIYFHQREAHGEEIRRLGNLIERIARHAK